MNTHAANSRTSPLSTPGNVDRKRRLHHVLVLIIIVLSGHPVFSQELVSEPYLLIYLFVLTFIAISERRPVLSAKLVVFFVVFALIFAIQWGAFGYFPLVTIAGVFVRVYIGYLLVSIVPEFYKTYINVMYKITCVTLPIFIFWEFSRFVGFDISQLFAFTNAFTPEDESINILIYNFSGKGVDHRNSSIFWEPGAYAGYCLLALVFNYFIGEPVKNRKFYIILLGLLSTVSTMGYVVLFVVFLLEVQLSMRSSKILMQGVAFFLVVGLSSLAVFNLPFIGEKIFTKFEQVEDRRDRWQITRWGNLVFDLEYIELRPLTGWGPNPRTRYALHFGEAIRGQGNGFTGSIVKYGLIGFGLYILMVFHSFKRRRSTATIIQKNYQTFIGLAVVILMLNSEQFLHYPLFWGLAFVRAEWLGINYDY